VKFYRKYEISWCLSELLEKNKRNFLDNMVRLAVLRRHFDFTLQHVHLTSSWRKPRSIFAKMVEVGKQEPLAGGVVRVA